MKGRCMASMRGKRSIFLASGLIGISLLACVCLAGREVTSANFARLKDYLQQHPDADIDKDGVLTLTEARRHIQKAGQQERRRKNPLSFAKGSGLRIVMTGHSWVAPAVGTLPKIAAAAGLDGHHQRPHLSGGGSGSANSIWLAEHGKYPGKMLKDILLPAIATGKWDVMTWGLYYNDWPEHYARWIDVCLQANPDMIFYIQDGWPRTPGSGSEYDFKLEDFLAGQKKINVSCKGLLTALNKKYPGKVRLIPVGDSLCELLKLYYANDLPGIEGLSKHLCGKEHTIWRDGGHIGKYMNWWEGYVYYAALYKKSPALIEAEFEVSRYNAELDKRMRQCAWKAVVNNPHTGITDKNENGIADEIEEPPRKDSRSSTAGDIACGAT